MVLCRSGSIELTATFYTRNLGGIRYEVTDDFNVRSSFESGESYTDRECLEMAVASFDRLAREQD